MFQHPIRFIKFITLRAATAAAAAALMKNNKAKRHVDTERWSGKKCRKCDKAIASVLAKY